MKRRSKEAIRSKVAEQIEEMQHSESIPTDTRTGREQLQSVLAPDIVTLPAKEKHKPESKPEIVLYLRDGVNPADKNFTKYPNEMHDLMTEQLTEYESLLYIKFWRESWGYGKNYCRIGYSTLLRETALRSKSTVTRAVAGLREKRFIVLALDEASSPKTAQAGTIYRVFAPSEILNGKTEEGTALQNIPIEGILCRSILSENTSEEPHKQGNDTGVFRESILQQGILTEKSSQGDDTRVVSQGIVTQSTPTNTGDYRAEGCIQREYTQRDYTFKEDSLKDSLSLDPIKTFYIGIGQKRITKTKREKGEKVAQELEADGFSLEDIQFAVKWTLKNAKEKPYDFSLLKDTIGQAISARHIEQQTAHKTREEAARVSAAETERRRLEDEIQKIRKGMSKKGLVELREKALEKIRNTDGIKEQFINEPLIIAKENEILRSKNEMFISEGEKP